MGYDDFLLLSGIQHFAFCERQWALVHLEQLWAENVRTIEGKHLHERADNPFGDESRGTIRVVRSVPVASQRLGLRGVADVVEWHQEQEYQEHRHSSLPGRKGWWHPVPIEYKRGRPKPDDRDAVQLCAQAMALEEMTGLVIPSGFIFYGDIRRREAVDFDERLRHMTIDLAARMHRLAQEGITPPPKKGKKCKSCSLVEECQPGLVLKHRSVADYLARMCHLEEDRL